MNYFSLDFDLQKLIDNIGRVANYFWERDWAGGNAGNISVQLKDFKEIHNNVHCNGGKFTAPFPMLAGDYYIVTASGRRMRDILNKPEENLCIVRIDDRGESYNVLWGCKTGRFPTSEFTSHLGAYNVRKETGNPVSVVMHTQPLDMITLSLIPEYQSSEKFSELIWKMQPETIINIPEGIAFLDYEIPGSEELAAKTVKAFRDGFRILLWANHGVIAAGNDLDEVLDLIDHANSSSVIALKLMEAGYNPRNLGLKNNNLTDLCRRFNLKNSPFYSI